MTLVELTAVKGGPVWVNAGQVLYIAGPEGAGGGSSMYGDNNVRTSSRIWFAQGVSLEVRESPGEILARLGAGGPSDAVRPPSEAARASA